MSRKRAIQNTGIWRFVAEGKQFIQLLTATLALWENEQKTDKRWALLLPMVTASDQGIQTQVLKHTHRHTGNLKDA